MRLIASFACAVILFCFSACPGHAEKRVALIIGNGAYRNEPALPNPRSDAQDVDAALKRSGFETILGLDLDKAGMEEAEIKFSRSARTADVAVFYYSGHAMQHDGVNYLFPVDAALTDEADLRRLARVDDILADLQEAKNLRILVLDSCRDNPLAEQLKRAIGPSRGATIARGLARIDNLEGMIISYATQAGRTADDGHGRNSPYTTAFLKHIEEPEEIGTIFRRVAADVYETTGHMQLPELSLSFIGEYYLRGRSSAAIPAPPPAPPPSAAAAAGPCGAATDHWRSAEAIGTVAAFEDHLARFPNCAFAALARQRIDILKNKVAALAPATIRPGIISPPPAPADGAPCTDRSVGGTCSFQKGGADVPVAIGTPKDDGEAARLYKRAADQGDALGEANLGFFYATGRGGLPKNDEEAARLFKLAAGKGDALGQARLGAFYAAGRGGLRKDDQEAIRLFKLAADQGEARGATNLGVFYALGRGGLARNDREAARLFKFAADKGEARGETNLGYFYATGRGGLPRNDVEAGRLFKLAADQADAPGQARLGAFYAAGRGGLPRNEIEAARLYRLAADQAEAIGQSNLGYFYAIGRGGLARNEFEAVRLFKLAADQGEAIGEANLGYFYQNGLGGLPKDDREAVRLYRLSAEQGEAIGEANLGASYQSGIGGLPKSDQEAARLYGLAAEQGNAIGQSNLGVLYAAGRGGLAKNEYQAALLFRLAADQGNALGEASLAYFYQNGRGGLPKNLQEAIRLYRLAADQGLVYAQTALKGLRVR